MESEPPAQRNCPACLTPQTFILFELGKINWAKATLYSKQLFAKVTGSRYPDYWTEK